MANVAEMTLTGSFYPLAKYCIQETAQQPGNYIFTRLFFGNRIIKHVFAAALHSAKVLHVRANVFTKRECLYVS